MTIRKGVLLGIGLIIVVAAGWLYYLLRSHPALDAYDELSLPAGTRPQTAVRATFLGVATILLDDGETAILTDGFFTRPSIGQLFFGKIAPDKALIARHLKHAGIDKLAAVIVNHSHYDHVMDAPEVAIETGALLVGSESTANVGRGWGLAEERIRIKPPGSTIEFGKFRVTLLASGHVPPGFPAGEITQPLVPPARVTAYLMGTNYAVLVEHGRSSILINASAGFAPGALAGRHADVVFLGIGMLGKRNLAYMEDYWREVVQTTGARRVIPIHWDNFALPLDEPLQPIPHLLDDFDATMRFLLEKGAAQGVEVKLPQAWQPIGLFP